MDKLEYIPGDLVKFATNYYTIVNFEENFPHNKICYGLISTNSTKTAFVADRDILPIPLTPEILEKNGWVKDTHRHCLDEMPAEAYEKKNFPLTHFNVTFGKKRIQASHDCLFVRNLKYVSDLQHLLFGLGLNSEMEV